MYPKKENKHEDDPLFTPNEFLDHVRETKGLPDDKIPETVVLCYTQSLLDYVKDSYKTQEIDFMDSFYLIKDVEADIGIVGNFGIGSPVAATTVEEFAELGTERFLNIGYAGALSEELEIGDVVVCTKAIRDEGTSYHYMEPSKYVEPPGNLTEKVEEILEENNKDFTKGTTWTIDTPYRETKKEVKEYRKEGVKTVEMEASAVFAVGNYRNVEVACIFSVSDHLTESGWEPEFFNTAQDPLNELFSLIVESIE